MSSRHYRLRCLDCGAVSEDDGLVLSCPTAHQPALLVTDYDEPCFRPDDQQPGIFRYHHWLPGIRTHAEAGGPVTYHSEALSRAAGLPNLWVGFNGYWPERGGTLETTTFKDLEAWAVLSRLPERHDGTMVLASAGNTAAAFARACSMSRLSCLIVVPEVGLPYLRFAEPLDPCVKIVSLVGFTDYSDANALADRIARLDGFYAEGGVRNVARRDGLATVMLNAVETTGRLPDYYFQAVGSGAGAISMHEVAARLIRAGGFGESFPRLMLSQNLPFAPLYTSWTSGRRQLVPLDPDLGRRQIQQIAAHVLSNREPPYGVVGGVFDVLTESGGEMLVADNLETLPAMALFEELEGIDIDPASAVAFATLLKAARSGLIERDAQVLLNVTGGGRHRRQLDRKLIPARPSLQLDQEEVLLEETLDKILALV